MKKYDDLIKYLLSFTMVVTGCSKPSAREQDSSASSSNPFIVPMSQNGIERIREFLAAVESGRLTLENMSPAERELLALMKDPQILNFNLKIAATYREIERKKIKEPTESEVPSFRFPEEDVGAIYSDITALSEYIESNYPNIRNIEAIRSTPAEVALTVVVVVVAVAAAAVHNVAAATASVVAVALSVVVCATVVTCGEDDRSLAQELAKIDGLRNPDVSRYHELETVRTNFTQMLPLIDRNSNSGNGDNTH